LLIIWNKNEYFSFLWLNEKWNKFKWWIKWKKKLAEALRKKKLSKLNEQKKFSGKYLKTHTKNTHLTY
jgi:hypothetical protein